MNVARGLVVQAQVVHALILRETRTRFGANQLGFLWALIEPVLFVATFYAFFALTERSAPPGMTIFGFMVTGVVPYLLFREASGRVAAAVSSNKGLLFYPQVRPPDLIAARILLEFTTFFLILAVLMGGESLVLGHGELEEPLLVLIGLALAGILGGAFGAALGSLAIFIPALERLTGAILRPLFWLSGVFYAGNDVPMALLEYIQYNPVLHCVELVRSGWYYSYDSHVVAPLYTAMFAAILALFALVFERASRPRIELS